mgnify:CR=1 FL=1
MGGESRLWVERLARQWVERLAVRVDVLIEARIAVEERVEALHARHQEARRPLVQQLSQGGVRQSTGGGWGGGGG